MGGHVEASNLSDERLLESLSDEAAFEELYRRHVGKVTAFATRRCTSPHEIPDLVAAVWLEVISSSHSFDPTRGQALPWILGVAANLTASNERRRAREREAVARLGRQPRLDPDDVVDLEQRLDAMGAAREALKALAGLPHGERLVAELVMLEGRTPRDAAHALGVRPATARMRLMRARSKLRDSLATYPSLMEDTAHVGGTT
jgi:RNA polymerase sigma factor (sigma-70 family)